MFRTFLVPTTCSRNILGMLREVRVTTMPHSPFIIKDQNFFLHSYLVSIYCFSLRNRYSAIAAETCPARSGASSRRRGSRYRMNRPHVAPLRASATGSSPLVQGNDFCSIFRILPSKVISQVSTRIFKTRIIIYWISKARTSILSHF